MSNPKISLSALVSKVAGETGQTKVLTKQLIDTFLVEVTKSLLTMTSVQLGEVGTLRSIRTKTREGRNPQNGEPMTIPAKNTVRFSAGTHLKKF